MATREDEAYSDEEARLLRFEFENRLPLQAANLGFDMHSLVHVDGAGKHLIEAAIDRIHVNMILLIDADLASAQAKNLQIEARAAKLVVDTVIEALENGRQAAFELEDISTEVEESDDG